MAHTSTQRLVVKRHRPWFTQIIIMFVLALFITQGWGLFNYGRDYGQTELLQLRHDRQRTDNMIKDLRKKNDRLSQKLAILERGGQIDRVAAVKIEKEIKNLQTDNANLRERLLFYENILKDAPLGLQIKTLAFSIAPKDQYRYKLVLAHIKSDEVRGQIDIKLEGTQGGRPRSFSLTNLVTDEKLRSREKIGFKFKYFKNVEGLLKLPTDFVPKLVKIEVVARGRKAAKIKKTYEWQEVAS